MKTNTSNATDARGSLSTDYAKSPTCRVPRRQLSSGSRDYPQISSLCDRISSTTTASNHPATYQTSNPEFAEKLNSCCTEPRALNGGIKLL
ncbi:MAG: hypothetical protein ACXWDN_02830 [Limisphaerales bacterium]